MNSHKQLSDTEFEQQFKSCSLNPVLFTHEAHLRLAWIHIAKYGLNQAIEHVTGQLLQFVHQLGAADKYNVTVTIVALKVVDHFMRKSTVKNFDAFITEFPRLNTNFRELIAMHYSIDIFNSAQAKLMYLAPDLLPFT